MDVADEEIFFPFIILEPEIFKDFFAVLFVVWVFSHPLIATPFNNLLFVNRILARAFCSAFIRNIWLEFEFVLVDNVIIQVKNACLD